MPIECDDEYWENDDPELAFKQPPGKPSLVTFFNCFLRLNQILAFALRTIVSAISAYYVLLCSKHYLSPSTQSTRVKHCSALLGSSGNNILSQRSTLLSTSGSIPYLTIVRTYRLKRPICQPLTSATVRWDPNRENLVFLNQSANLYASYYQLQISVHRPFIPSPRKPSPLSFPSLAICTNAARSCTHVMDVQCRRAGSPLPYNQVCLHVNIGYQGTGVMG